MFEPGQVISHLEMSQEEKVHLQKGMNFRLGGTYSVILMSLRRGAPYADRVEDDGKTLIYEGHDIPKRRGVSDPKKIDQPNKNPSGSLNENGRFERAAKLHKNEGHAPELVRVYEKLHT